MVDFIDSIGQPKGIDPRIHSLRDYNSKLSNYKPLHERVFGLHSQFINKRAELQRPNLNVVEFGAGRPSSYLNRAMQVVARGGKFTAIDLDPQFVTEAQQEFRQYTRGGNTLMRNVVVVEGNCNATLTETIPGEEADVVIINSVAANATPKEVRSMLEVMQREYEKSKKDSVRKVISFLENFSVRGIPSGIPEDYSLPGVKGNVLALANAFQVLKDGGRLVYAHNDQGMMHLSTKEVSDICDQIGFSQIKTYDPYYNSLNLGSIATASASKYDMGVVVAIK